jgi:hypothetical protein
MASCAHATGLGGGDVSMLGGGDVTCRVDVDTALGGGGGGHVGGSESQWGYCSESVCVRVCAGGLVTRSWWTRSLAFSASLSPAGPTAVGSMGVCAWGGACGFWYIAPGEKGGAQAPRTHTHITGRPNKRPYDTIRSMGLGTSQPAFVADGSAASMSASPFYSFTARFSGFEVACDLAEREARWSHLPPRCDVVASDTTPT